MMIVSRMVWHAATPNVYMVKRCVFHEFQQFVRLELHITLDSKHAKTQEIVEQEECVAWIWQEGTIAISSARLNKNPVNDKTNTWAQHINITRARPFSFHHSRSPWTHQFGKILCVTSRKNTFRLSSTASMRQLNLWFQMLGHKLNRNSAQYVYKNPYCL